MSNNMDTKSNTVEDKSKPPEQPPPPYSGGSDGSTSISATEQTQLLPSRAVAATYTSPYSPTQNLTYPPIDNNGRTYYQHDQTVILSSPVVPLSTLRTMPAMTICPHCQHSVLSIVRYESGGCTWLCCVALSFFTPLCFIPFCITDLKDAIHSCPNCGKVMAKYCRFDGNVYQRRG